MKRSTEWKEINVSLRKKSVEKYFKNISKNGVVSNKNIWNIITPFLTNKSHINVEEITLKRNNEAIAESSVLTSHYINIVEKTSGKNPSHFASDNNVIAEAIDLIVQLYLAHPSTNHIKTTS